jgi:hypothetical protein
MIWRGRPFRNGGLEGYAKCRPISGPTGVIFLHQISNLLVEVVTTGVALMPYPKHSGEPGMTRIYLVKTL